jgi:Acetyltransferase (GNAT) domain
MPDFYWSWFGGGTHMSLHAYRVEFFETASQLPNALWDACFQLPAEGRWWYETLDQSGIEDQFTLFYGLIEHLGRPVGIAPGFVMDLPVEQVAPKEFLQLLRLVGKIAPSLLCQRIVFVGSPILDEGRVGLLTHVNRRTALLSLQVALEKKAHELSAPLIVWKDFPESSSADLNWLSHERRLFRVVSLPNTIVEFPSHRKEDYFATMKGTRRRNLKKRLRLSREQVALGVEIVQRPDANTLDNIFELFWQTYEKSATKFERLNRKFFEVISEKPAAHFIILRERVTDEMVAFMLFFDMGERLINMYIGMDYGRPKQWMLLFRLWEAAVDVALSRGFSSIVSGRSSYEAKIQIGHKLVPLNNYCRHRNIFLHNIYRISAHTIHWASMDEGLTSFLTAHPDTFGQKGGRIIHGSEVVSQISSPDV